MFDLIKLAGMAVVAGAAAGFGLVFGARVASVTADATIGRSGDADNGVAKAIGGLKTAVNKLLGADGAKEPANQAAATVAT